MSAHHYALYVSLAVHEMHRELETSFYENEERYTQFFASIILDAAAAGLVTTYEKCTYQSIRTALVVKST